MVSAEKYHMEVLCLATPRTDVANGDPTKDFFLHMLTRDIELNDAILDLLDNCLDGVLRSGDKTKINKEQIYAGYEAHIEINGDSFCIWDNCGGIPFKIAQEYAFMMGRPPKSDDGENLPTVGIYGIGMKRAIFKIGKEGSVCSNTPENEFCVYIPESWATEQSWGFKIKHEKTDLQKYGTKIVVTKLHPNIWDKWQSPNLDSFLTGLRTAIQGQYSFIIEKGFTVFVNKVEVKSKPVKVLFSNMVDMRPYIYQEDVDGVEIRLVAGFYRPMPSEEEVEDLLKGSGGDQRKSTEAGWTVICNDRVVLYNDKTHLTGWGEAGVPNYHTQFIGVKGVVHFRSNDPGKLPMTTTKRGIDLSSPIYSKAKEKMRAATKVLTGYTNKWKAKEGEEKRLVSDKSQAIILQEFFKPAAEVQKKFSSITFSTRAGATTYSPKLAIPDSESPVNRVIRFSKPYDEIKAVATYLFDDPDEDIAPSVVGEECFRRALVAAGRKKK